MTSKKLRSRGVLEVWKDLKEAGRGAFEPESRDWLVDRTRSGTGPPPNVSLLSAIRALELAEHEANAGESVDVDLVATTPVPLPGVLETRNVVRQLLNEAISELLVVGFVLSDREMLSTLLKRGRRVRVCVVAERGDTGAAGLARDWPTTNLPLMVLEQAEPLQGENHIMHGKVIVADRKTALIGSANFTLVGLGKNYEFGVRVTGSIAQQVVRAVEQLAEKKWLVPA